MDDLARTHIPEVFSPPGIVGMDMAIIGRGLCNVQTEVPSLRFNMTGLPVAVIGAVTNGPDGVMDQFTRIFHCGFFVETMFGKELSRNTIMTMSDALLWAISISPIVSFKTMESSVRRMVDTIRATGFLGQYVEGGRELDSPSKDNPPLSYRTMISILYNPSTSMRLRERVRRYITIQ